VGRSIYVMALFLSITVLCCAETSTAGQAESVPGINGEAGPSIYLGIEYAELAQNNFSDLGADNFTLLAGQRFRRVNFSRVNFSRFDFSRFGWRFLAVNAELSSAHLSNPDQVAFIEGNRDDLSGDVFAARVYWDYYPFTLDLGHCSSLRAPILSVSPVVSLGLGYNSWGFSNTLFDENYRLNAVTLSLGACLHTELFGFLFIENPMLDFFVYMLKNREVEGSIGDTSITRPEYWGIFSWATIGIKIRTGPGGKT